MSHLGRPLEFNPDQAVDAATQVFWCKGYEATSMAELLDAMNLSRSSLYQAFGSKQQLFERCLTHYGDWQFGSMEKNLAEATSGRSFIINTFAAIVNTAQQLEGARGCLIVNSANEFGQSEPGVANILSEGLERFAGIFMDAVVKAQAEGDISTDSDPEALANYLMMSLTGLRTMIKAGADKRVAEEAVTLTLRTLG